MFWTNLESDPGGSTGLQVNAFEAAQHVFTVRLLALRILKDEFPSIFDAVEPGGSGDMYKNLTPEQQDVLREVTRMGFPPQAWFNYKTIGPGAFPVLFGMVRMMDRSYFEDFWKVPSYAGAIRRHHLNGFTSNRTVRRATRLLENGGRFHVLAHS